MALSVIDFHVSFALHTTTKKFIISDLTDYAGQSVTLSDANGVLKITDPDGTVLYSNVDYTAPDIDVDVSLIDTAAVSIPLDSSGDPKTGTYTFSYSVKDDNDGTIVSKEKTFNYQYAAPTVDISITSDCLTPKLKSVDTTGYTFGGVTPVSSFPIVAADTGSNFFSINGNYTGLFTATETFYVTGSTGNDNSGTAYTITSVVYDSVNDQTDVYVASVVDATADGSITTRSHKIYYPASLELASTDAHTTTLSVNSFYTGTQTSSIAVTQFWEFANEISIVDDFSAVEEIEVDCDQRLCDIYCALIGIYDKWQENKSTNLVLANAYRDRLTGALPLLTLLKEAFECGKDDKIDSIKADIYEISGASADCSCADGEPSPIKGIGTAATTVVESSGSGLIVSSSVLGDVTTYTVSLDADTYARITNAYNTRVVAGTSNIIITESDVDAANEKTFTVTVDDTANQPNIAPALDFSVDLTFTGSAVTISTPIAAIANPIDWAAFATPTISDVNAAASPYQNLDANFKVENFNNLDVTTNFVVNHSHEIIQTPESLVGSTKNLTGTDVYRGVGFYPLVHSRGIGEFYFTFMYGDIAKIANNGNLDGAIIRMFFSLRATPSE